MSRTIVDRSTRAILIVVVVASAAATGCSSDTSPASAVTAIPVPTLAATANTAIANTVASNSVAANTATTNAATTNAATTNAVTTNTVTTNAVTLVDFADRGAAGSWSSQNDTVMGGRSKGAASWLGGALVFSGSLSLENNGGFSSVVGDLTQPSSRTVPSINTISVVARGDGKTYVLQLRTGDDSVRYVQRFTTEAGVERTYSLALAAFEPVNFQLSPVKNAPRIDPFAVTRLALYILDKQSGPFELNIRRIDAVS